MATLKAAEEVLLAATKLAKRKKEFTEWELTVEAWKVNPQRWGLPGFQERYPDHKRVMNEVMARGSEKVLGRGWLRRIRPNYYSVTQSGFAKASTFEPTLEQTGMTRGLNEYDSIAPYANHDVFLRYCKSTEEPKTWLGVAAFLRLEANNKHVLERKLRTIEESINLALGWMVKNNKNEIRRSDAASYAPITREQVLKLRDFLTEIQRRFKPQFDAIRSK